MDKVIEFLRGSRVKSFMWRSGMMILAYACTAVVSQLGVLEFSTGTTTVLGLILGEISKALNNQIQGK